MKTKYLDCLLTTIIDISFAELKRVKISIGFEDCLKNHDSHCYYAYKNKNYFIGIGTTLNVKDHKNIIIGAIAHELCHIVWEISTSERHFNKDYALFESNFMHRQRDEQYTDLQTILRGYGKELKELMLYYHQHPTKEYIEECNDLIKEIINVENNNI